METDDEAVTGSAVEPALDQPFELANLVALRGSVAAHADALGLPARRISELVLLVHELASNAVRHGGGRGHLRIWVTDGALHCQVSDDGPGLSDHYFGTRTHPALDASGGRGIWLVRGLCDRLDWRSGQHGTVITASIDLDG
jgi:anti-sigma regulatory factor (Ser/Thr protein kinase)